VDVVILTWNDGVMLAAAISSALVSVDAEIAVWVVDNGSDQIAEVGNDARVHLLRNDENRGVAAGRNQGIAAGSAPLVLLLDSDARLEPDCLARLVAALDDDDVALVAPVYVDQRPEESAGRAPSPWLKVLRALNLRDSYDGPPPDDRPVWDVDFAIGACQLFRRSVWSGVDGIDERYFYGPEDVDFCLRIREAGHRILQVRDARCVHPPRRRHKNLLTAAGLRHGYAVIRHLWRHRGFSKSVAMAGR